VSDNIVDVVNTSFAACELDDTLELALEPVLAQGAAQGIAFEGVQFGTPTTCDYKGIDPIMVPGGDVNSLAVGASNAIADPSGALTAQSGLPASGGGVSLIVPLPAFQNGISGINPAGRNTPDLVLAGEVNSVGPSAYFTAENFGGPSGPPGWNGGFVFANNAPAAGMLADLQQMVHHRLGAFNRTLYRLFGADGYGAAFSDITSGCDGLVGSTPLCARQGYDVTSGIGSVDVYRLGKLLH
jgi:subtilase family serine protease